MIKAALLLLGVLSFLSQAKTLSAQAEDASLKSAKLSALKALVKQIDPLVVENSALSLLFINNLPEQLGQEIASADFSALGVVSSEQSVADKYQVIVSFDVSARLLHIQTSIAKLQNTLTQLKPKLDSLSLDNLSLMVNADAQLSALYRLKSTLEQIEGTQLSGLTETRLNSIELNRAYSRIDAMSQLVASSSLPEQSAAAKDIFTGLAEQISVTIKSRSTTESQLDSSSVSQQFNQLTETLTNQTLTGVKITPVTPANNQSQFVGTLFPRQSAIEVKRELALAYQELVRSIGQNYDSSLDQSIAHLKVYQRYSDMVSRYNTLVRLYSGNDSVNPSQSLTRYVQTLELGLNTNTDHTYTLADVGKIVGYYNGDKHALSLCPVLPTVDLAINNTTDIRQSLSHLINTDAERVLRLSIKDELQLLAEIVSPSGQTLYSQTFLVKPTEYDKKSTDQSNMWVSISDTSAQAKVSRDELFDILMQEIDLADAKSIKPQCLPDLTSVQNKQALSILTSSVVELDVNYLFESVSLSGPSTTTIEFCKVSVNGKAHDLLKGKTIPLRATDKKPHYTDYQSGIAEASAKAFKKLNKRLAPLSARSS